ncbi:hypothetical protein HZA44_01275 [Candidatus Peregrinibacteria bacterium]|nr:hypothetical protein [Candidatus Peregrinibacteria bacterium]
MADGESSHVSKGRNLLKSVLLCAALGISGCATPGTVGAHASAKADASEKNLGGVNPGVDAGRAVEKRRNGVKSNGEGEMEEIMRNKCEEEGYLNPIDCNLDTDPEDPSKAKVKFRAVFI